MQPKATTDACRSPMAMVAQVASRHTSHSSLARYRDGHSREKQTSHCGIGGGLFAQPACCSICCTCRPTSMISPTCSSSTMPLASAEGPETHLATSGHREAVEATLAAFHGPQASSSPLSCQARPSQQTSRYSRAGMVSALEWSEAWVWGHASLLHVSGALACPSGCTGSLRASGKAGAGADVLLRCTGSPCISAGARAAQGMRQGLTHPWLNMYSDCASRIRGKG